MAKYDFTAMPVVDSAGKMVGVVTVDDVLDVIQEQAEEDLLHLAGVDISETMVNEATRFNAAQITDRRVELCVGTSSNIPFPDAAFDRAVDAGATIVWPVRNGHGWRLGRVVDPFGHHWEIGKPLEG